MLEKRKGTAPPASIANDDSSFQFELDLEANYAGKSVAELIAMVTDAQYQVLFASRYLANDTFASPTFAQAREKLDIALLHLARAKWFIGSITTANNALPILVEKPEAARIGIEAASFCSKIAKDVRQALLLGTRLDTIKTHTPELSYEGTECLRAGGVPIVPSICPTLIIGGSAYEMGYQYAQQVMQIYGDFVFRKFSEIGFTQERLDVMRRFEEHLETHTPDILQICKGWADGATESGLPMSYENVLHLWVGAEAPSRSRDAPVWPFIGSERLTSAMYFGQKIFAEAQMESAKADHDIGLPLPRSELADRCSGFCAWGTATQDGGMVAGATTDHDCWMQASIIAYPDEGNPFIYTPFSVAGGWIPGMGLTRMGGHPGMNNKGLAYIHHGGEPHMMEPPETWGYGVPRGALTFHSLQHHNSTEDVLSLQFSIPIGDVGSVIGSGGGQWVDTQQGIIIESRHRSEEHPEGVIRKSTFDSEGHKHDILYAGNNSMAPDAPSCNHGFEEGALTYDVERGWYARDPVAMMHKNPMVSALRVTASQVNADRSKTFYAHSIPASGSINAEWVERMYSTPSDYSEPSDVSTDVLRMSAGEILYTSSPAHRGNACTAVIQPDNGDQGLYSLAIGPIRYDLPPRGGTHGYFYHDETNEMWTIRLAATKEELVEDAADRAEAYLLEANQLLRKLEQKEDELEHLFRFKARAEQSLAKHAELKPDATDPRKYNSDLARKLRHITRAQVRARQIVHALRPSFGLERPNEQ